MAKKKQPNQEESLRLATRMYLSAKMKHFTKMMFPANNNGSKFIFAEHHEIICNALDRVFNGDVTKLIINIAPRYGKTELVVKQFISKGFAMNPASSFIHLSYSGKLTMDNSMAIKDIVSCDYFKNVYPLRIRKGSDTKARWDTVQGGGLYATSTLGQITGFGAGDTEEEYDEEEEERMLDAYSAIYNPNMFTGAIVIDDPIKPEDAFSDVVRETVNRRFETTIRNRVNSRKIPIIIIMQRLHEEDLCGYLQKLEEDEWEVISLPCVTEDDEGNRKALWEHKHTLEELGKIEDANSFVYQTQYLQDPRPVEGFMYQKFRTYDIIPSSKRRVRKNYTDTADTGKDFLCSICYIETEIGNYITDVLYSKKPMEYTEPKTAEMLMKNKTEVAIIESNNGGRGFARNVERELRQNDFTRIKVTWFHQSENKNVRIFSNSADVQNVTFYPADWEKRWPRFFKDVRTYMKEGNNKNDDAPDTLTGMFEKRGKGEKQDLTGIFR